MLIERILLMVLIVINNCEYKIHAIYNLYAGSKNGNIIHIIKRVPNEGKKINVGYMKISVRRCGESKQKKYFVHRFIWECGNGLIPNDKEIDHINDIKMITDYVIFSF